ncbi:MAG: RNA methyltransferase [Actinobacteria bacterium]|nr:RNA methyltransferase [Actinomycetota bacterium]
MIESLNSPHVARVKALISSRGTKERKAHGEFVAEGLQCFREAIVSKDGPQIESLYLTASARVKLDEITDLSLIKTYDVSDDVMKSMSETITPQGILAICSIPQRKFESITLNGHRKFIYLSEVQDPGNAGTILRSADAFGMDAVLTSPGSVDMYSPKVVRSTAGSLWHIPVFEGVALSDLLSRSELTCFSLAAQGSQSLADLAVVGDTVAIFGNEARGLSTAQLSAGITLVNIPMPGDAESLNLSAAASIVMYHLANMQAS